MNRRTWLSIRNNGGPLTRRLRNLGTMLHKSCSVAMLPEPTNPAGPRVIPWTERPGHTLKLGRNAAKRAARAGKSRKHWPTLSKAQS